MTGPVPEPDRLVNEFREQVPGHLRVAQHEDALQITCLSCGHRPFYVAEFGDRTRRTRAEAIRILRDEFAVKHMHGAPIPSAWLDDPLRGMLDDSPYPAPYDARRDGPPVPPPAPVKYEEPWLQSRQRDALLQDGEDKRAALAAAERLYRHAAGAGVDTVLDAAGKFLDWLRYSGYPQRYMKGTDDETQS